MISRTVTQPPGEPMEEPEETIHPDPEVVANAWVGDWRALEERAAADLEGYWAERAGELEAALAQYRLALNAWRDAEGAVRVQRESLARKVGTLR